jgi:membrane protein implicated in regulation of membrane protease activity
MKVNRIVFFAWFAPLIFMIVAFYVLFNSQVPLTAKLVFTVVPVVIWLLGGLAIYREYRDQEGERRREEEVLEEAKRILNGSKDPAGKSRYEERRD